MSRKVKEVIRTAGLRDELTFMSLRHGEFTKAGDAELTDRELVAQGRHKPPKVLGKYVKADYAPKSPRVSASVTQREQPAHSCRNEHKHLCRNEKGDR